MRLNTGANPKRVALRRYVSLRSLGQHASRASEKAHSLQGRMPTRLAAGRVPILAPSTMTRILAKETKD